MSATLKQAKKILSVFEETPREQIQEILGSGLLADLRDGNIAKVNRDDFRKMLGLKPLTPKPESLLKFLGTVSVPATTELFVAKNKFVTNTSREAPVKINYIGDNFKEWFLFGDGKTKELIGERTLCYAKLRKGSTDAPIIAELGGEAKAETTLAEIFDLMAKQANGEKGALLNNGWANIFYVCDQKGVLRAVDAYWRGVGWRVVACSVECPSGWGDGGQVFSRNS